MREPIAMKYSNPAYPERLGHLYDFQDCSKGVSTLSDDERQRIRVMVTAGLLGATEAEMDLLPNLGLICCVGTGFENVDLSAAQQREILVTHGAGVNADAVADQAFGLLMAAVRGIAKQDRIARQGGWNTGWQPAPMFSGKKLGIFGMGRIGEAIARRAAGFNIDVLYYSRTPKQQLPYLYVSSLIALASASDFLVCCVPGGDDTYHSINGTVLKALGSKGFVVNVGRGSVVSTDALSEALSTGVIAGAGLDVYETEPVVPEALRTLDNLVMTLHTASYAPEVQDLTANALSNNIQLFLTEKRVISPVPGMPSVISRDTRFGES
jgi:lactate dehydrogenase-like 2-hydroxyacid dehydrogenase